MNSARNRKVTLRYIHDELSGKTSITVDVKVDEDEMPHEHRQDLKQMAEELLGVPLGSLPDEIQVRLQRQGGHHHPHPEHTHPDPVIVRPQLKVSGS